MRPHGAEISDRGCGVEKGNAEKEGGADTEEGNERNSSEKA